MAKHLDAEENIVGQAKKNIKNLDKVITKAQNPSTHLFGTFYISFAIAIKSATATIQT